MSRQAIEPTAGNAVSSPSPELPPRQRFSLRGACAIAVFVVGAACVALVIQRNIQLARAIDGEHFRRLTDEVSASLTDRLRTERFLIESVKSTFRASDWVSREEFQTLADSLELPSAFPASDGVGFIRVVPAGEASSEGGVVAADGDSRWVVDYYVSAGGESSDGPTLETPSAWADAIHESLRRGRDAATQPIGAHFVWLTPVFENDRPLLTQEQRRAAVTGWVFSLISTEELLTKLDERVERRVAFAVSDTTSGIEFGRSPSNRTESPQDWLAVEQSLSVGGREWKLSTVATTYFAPTPTHAGATAVGGALLAGALALLVHWQAQKTKMVSALVREKTAELADARDYFENVFNSIDARIGILSHDGVILTTNSAWRDNAVACCDDLLQLDEGEDYLARCDSITGPARETAENLGDAIRSVIAREDDHRVMEHPACGDRWFQTRVSQFVGCTEAAAVVAHVDITDRVVAKMASQEETRRATALAHIVEESPNEFYIIDREDLRFIVVNRGAVKATGYSREELLTMRAIDLTPEFDEAAFRKKIAPLVRNEINVLEFRTEHQRADDLSYPVQVSLHSAEYNGTPVYVAFVTDLSEVQRLENRLSQAQKLESLGQLAAGIAHEINTPMQCVSNNVEFLNQCHEQLFNLIDQLLFTMNPPVRPWAERREVIDKLVKEMRYARIAAQAPDAIKEAAEASRRVVEIVRAMKAMSHPGQQHKSDTDINGVLSNAATISRNRWKYAAEIDLQLDESLPAIPALPAELNQVFLNLIVNAADAIVELNGEGGEMGKITIRSTYDDEFVWVEVHDTGGGVPEEIRTRIFDPFFTTKEVGKGTGQGLSIAYDVVVNKPGGMVDLMSTPGVGTTFVVQLPIAPLEDKATSEEIYEELAVVG